MTLQRDIRSAHYLLRARPALLVGITGFLALGLYLRLDSLASSLWIDEFGTFWVVEHDLTTTLLRAWQFQGQSPFYYVLAWVSVHVAGESEVALRAPSLVFGALFIAAIYLCARMLAGPSAGWYAAGLGWFSVPVIRASVEARPYALVLFSVAIAILGFHWAVRSPSRPARVLWILGGAGVAWSHYVQYPTVLGLFMAYALLPALRTKYTTGRFLVDGLCQFGLVAVCGPQILALLARRDTLSWIDEPRYLAFLPLLIPLFPCIALGEALGRRDRDRVAQASRWSLWLCLMVHVGTLQLAALGGMNLLDTRYFMAILVTGLLLAATALSRIRAGEAVAAVLGFAIITGGVLAATKRGSGSFSGIGYDDWRAAITELSQRLRDVSSPVVLYRSGFVEEDTPPLGTPVAATRAPLRSPGRNAFEWQVKSLSYRWSNPRRAEYFARTLVPQIRGSSRFLVVSARSGTESRTYPDQFVRWVEQKWPATFEVERTSFGGVELIEFRRLEH